MPFRGIEIEAGIHWQVEGREIVTLLIQNDSKRHAIAWRKAGHREMDRILRKECFEAVGDEFGIAFKLRTISAVLRVR